MCRCSLSSSGGVANDRVDVPVNAMRSRPLREDQPLARREKKARLDKRTIVFMIDESGLSLKPRRCRTWAPRRETLVLQYQFNWKTLSAIASGATRDRGSIVAWFFIPLPSRTNISSSPKSISWMRKLGEVRPAAIEKRHKVRESRLHLLVSVPRRRVLADTARGGSLQVRRCRE